MWRRTLEAGLHRHRIVLSGLLLLTICYFILYSWASFPPLTFFLGWHPDTQLTVLPVIEEAYQPFVQPGDVVLSIDGRATRRGHTIFSYPIKPSYQFTLQRGEQTITQDLPVVDSELAQFWQVSTSILALLIWFVAFLTVQFARQDQLSALYVGFGFQLIAAGILSPGPAQLGAPGGWLIGHVLVFYFPLIVFYLSLVPQNAPMNPAFKKIVQAVFLICTLFAVIAAYEFLFLFPERSLADIIGIRSLSILTFMAGISIVGSITTLVARLIHSPQRSYERQQLTILLVFLALAILPLLFFVIVPGDQSSFFAPFPTVYSLFLFAPAGYFFILHRQGHLQLDTLFSRIVTVVIMILAITIAFTTALYLLDAVFGVEFSAIGQGIFFLALFGVTTVNQRQVQNFVELLIYGRDQLDDESIQQVRTRLSASPEPATVKAVISELAAYMNVQRAALVYREDGQYRLLTSNVDSFEIPERAMKKEVSLRAREPNAMADLPTWVELSIPIMARGDLLGALWLSRPQNSYYNARQVETLQDVSDILAFSLLVISLVETMHDLSRQALYEKELQRQQIATEIHNEPLHSLTTLMLQLQSAGSDAAIHDVATTIRHVTRDLRRIISGLRPPVLKESVRWMTHQIVREFEETHDDMAINLHLDIRTEVQATEQTKLAFYYILTEALNNVSKHSKATRLDVSLIYGEDTLTLMIRDNGEGPGAATASLTELLRMHHLGVTDMYRWASLVGGNVTIESNIPSGTAITLEMPLAAS